MCMMCLEVNSESAKGQYGPWEKDPHQHSSSMLPLSLVAHTLLLHTDLGYELPPALSRGPQVAQTWRREVVIRHQHPGSKIWTFLHQSRVLKLLATAQ